MEPIAIVMSAPNMAPFGAAWPDPPASSPAASSPERFAESRRRAPPKEHMVAWSGGSLNYFETLAAGAFVLLAFGVTHSVLRP